MYMLLITKNKIDHILLIDQILLILPLLFFTAEETNTSYISRIYITPITIISRDIEVKIYPNINSYNWRWNS